MYRAFSALSESMSGELDEPPLSLRENVMAEIRREQLWKHNHRRIPWSGVAAAAAILALVIGFAPRLTALGRTEESALTAQMAAGAMYASYDEGSEDSMEMPEAEYEAPLANAENRKDAGSDGETEYVTMDTEAAATAENAIPDEEDENHYVIFGAEISEDGELTEEALRASQVPVWKAFNGSDMDLAPAFSGSRQIDFFFMRFPHTSGKYFQ